MPREDRPILVQLYLLKIFKFIYFFIYLFFYMKYHLPNSKHENFYTFQSFAFKVDGMSFQYLPILINT